MPSTVPVNPEIITWARNYHSLTQQQLADKVGVHLNQIIKWEDEKTQPTFTQAKKLAGVLHLPFVYLFLSDPPDLETPLPDLRTRATQPATPSPNFREILYETFDRYEWYREYLAESGALKELAFVGSFTQADDPLRIAADIRKIVSITPETRQVKSWSAYLKVLSQKVEDIGVMVMRSGLVGKGTNRGLNADEFQGFVITDRYAPLVFVNARDYIAAQIFTLAHELAHIWIGKAGIIDPDETEVAEPTRHVESFCNSIATEVLVPESEFAPLWATHGRSTATLAEEFRVSEIVCLRRAYELNLITSDEFWPRWRQLKDAARQRSGFGLSTYLEKIATRHSPLFMDAVINDTRAGGTPFRDGARLLSMTLPTFTEMIEGREY